MSRGSKARFILLFFQQASQIPNQYIIMTSKNQKVPPNGNQQSVRFVEIDEHHAGQRIDNFLLTYLKGVPRTHIYRIVRKGEVRVNKGRTKPLYKLCVGDVVRIPPVRVSEAKSVPTTISGKLAELKNCFIYEDSALIVLNKPSGIAVHGGSGISLGVIESLRVLMPREKRLELVHRLDRDTSGCLIIAKKASVLKKLHEMIRADQMEKQYVALLKGQIHDKKIIVNAPLKKFVTQSGERMVTVADDGKVSKTIFYPKRVFETSTLADVKLITGRTHQIRVHSLHLDHNIAGDEKYGDKKFNAQMKTIGLKRLFLHARSIRFKHPVTDEIMNPVAPMDKQLTGVIKKLSDG